MTGLQGKVALVTGAGSGVGKASAMLMAKAGAKVALISRTKDELQKLQYRIEADGGEAISLEADISDEQAMMLVVEKIQHRWNRLDIVHANAGVNGVWAPLQELKLEEWEQTLRINLTGTFLTIKVAEPLLRLHGGSIIITASVNGTRMFSNSGATAYATSKAGQVALAKMLALELARFKIRVNVICPGAIHTSINDSTERRNLEDLHLPAEFPEGTVPLNDGEAGNANQVGELVCFLASDASSHISGTEIFIDGAQSLFQG